MVGSDHAPLVFTISSMPFRKCHFRFEVMWSRSHECEKTINQAWNCSLNGYQSNALLANLKNCQSKLTSWSHDSFSNNRIQISALTNQLKHLQDEDPSQKNLLHREEILTGLDELWAREEMFWHQRSRINWINFGDSNSQFFHLMATVS